MYAAYRRSSLPPYALPTAAGICVPIEGSAVVPASNPASHCRYSGSFRRDEEVTAHLRDVAKNYSRYVIVVTLERYADLPMDYADATLVVLVDRLRVTAIATIDVHDFSSYRLANGEGTRKIPGALPDITLGHNGVCC